MQFKKIIITGAGGYIPTYLIKLLLAKGHEVIGIDNGFGRTLDSLIEFCSNPNFTFVKGDACNEDLIAQYKPQTDFIILAHSLVGEPICNKYANLAWEVNGQSIGRWTNTKPFDIPILLTSTGSVFGKVDGVANEQSPVNPLSIYAKSKLLAEEFVEKVPHITYRFATAFGLATSSYRLDLLVNDFVYQAYKNKSLVLFQADFRRTFCHVRDLADSIVFGIDNFDKMKNNLYLVGNKDGNWSKRKLAEFISKKTGCSLFIGEEGYKDTDLRDYDTDFSLINSMGWAAKVSMEQGIEELIKMCPLLKTQNQYLFV